MKLVDKTAVVIAAILAVLTHQTNARLLEKEQGSDVSTKTENSNSILEPLYPDERDLELFDGGTTEDSMRAARMEEPAMDMRAARMDEGEYVKLNEMRAAEMRAEDMDMARMDMKEARLDGGEYVKLDEMRAAEMRAEDMARMDMRAAEDIDMARIDDMRAEDIDMARMDMKEARMARDMGDRDMQENPYGVPLP